MLAMASNFSLTPFVTALAMTRFQSGNQKSMRVLEGHKASVANKHKSLIVGSILNVRVWMPGVSLTKEEMLMSPRRSRIARTVFARTKMPIKHICKLSAISTLDYV
jgi:hypothetical protein